MRWSLRLQLLIPLLTLLLGMVGMSAWTALASAQRARHSIERTMHDIAGTLAAVKIPPNHHTLPLLKGLSGAEFLRCDASGRPVQGDDGKPLTTLAELPDALPGATAAWQSLSDLPRVHVAGVTYFALGVPLGADEESRGTVYIFYPESLWRGAVWEAVKPSLYVGIIGGLASLVLTVAVTQRLSRRVRELERRTRLIAAGDFSPMPLPRRNDELRDLAQSVNDMAQQLAQFQETVKLTERLRLLGQVSGGLAHQLRNGVTGARLAVQLHARTCNGQADAESLDVALRQLSLVESHLKRFLDLGKASELQKQPCDLVEIIQETVTLLRPQCRHANIDLRTSPPCPDVTSGLRRDARRDEPLTVLGDRGHLGHLLLNLVSNAVDAAGPGGWIEIRWRLDVARVSKPAATVAGSETGPTRVIIEIIDSGPGPSPEVAERLFEPFVTGKPHGVGLGLAVARQVAQAHGGTIRWRRVDQTTCFEIELPLHPHGSQTRHAAWEGSGK